MTSQTLLHRPTAGVATRCSQTTGRNIGHWGDWRHPELSLDRFTLIQQSFGEHYADMLSRRPTASKA